MTSTHTRIYTETLTLLRELARLKKQSILYTLHSLVINELKKLNNNVIQHEDVTRHYNI